MTQLKLRILFDDAMLGPGKADLLHLIQQTGSISAAGKSMNMSYKRAWMLVEEMNAAFHEPLVSRSRGGAGGGGATLTKAGQTVLSLYQDILRKASQAISADVARLESMLKPAEARDMSVGE